MLSLSDGRELAGLDTLLWATGRAPNTDALGAERAGLALSEDGRVIVDELQRTNVPGIYAVGDVTGGQQLTPVAIAAGRRLAERLYQRAARPAARLRLCAYGHLLQPARCARWA